MPFGDAVQLTPRQAMFVVSGEAAMKAACRRMNRLSHFGRDATGQEIVAAFHTEMAARRKHFTGSEDIALTEAEQRPGDEEPLRRYW